MTATADKETSTRTDDLATTTDIAGDTADNNPKSITKDSTLSKDSTKYIKMEENLNNLDVKISLETTTANMTGEIADKTYTIKADTTITKQNSRNKETAEIIKKIEKSRCSNKSKN